MPQPRPDHRNPRNFRELEEVKPQDHRNRDPGTRAYGAGGPGRRPLKGEDILSGSFWMVAITLLLFFLPIVNGLIGGLVGGYKVGEMRGALISAILPAIAAGAGLWVILVILGLPLVGFIAGIAVAGWIVLSQFGLLAGAMIGGAIGGMKRDGT